MGHLQRERDEMDVRGDSRYCYAAVGAAVAGAAVSTVGGALLADDGGAGDANAAATDATRMQAQIAREQWNRYKTIYAPLEDSMVSAAQNYDTPAQYEKAAGAASGSVAQAFGNARDRLTRTPGLDPTSPAYASSMAGLDRTQAAADAVAQNGARKQVQDTAWARKSDMLSLGKGLPAQAATGLAAVSQQSANQANAAWARGANQAAGLGNAVATGINAFGANSGPGLGSGQVFSSQPSYGFGLAPPGLGSVGTIGGYSGGGYPSVGGSNYGFGQEFSKNYGV